MDRRPFVVGEGPSRTGDRYYRFPLSGAPARTLCTCAGWGPAGPRAQLASWTWALYAKVRTRNVFRRYAESVPWSKREARVRARAILAEAEREGASTIVLLGRRVGEAFEVRSEFGVFEPIAGSAIMAVVIPHPSGRNLLMNDPEIRALVGRTLRLSVCAPGC